MSAAAPVNFRKQDHSPAAIAAAVDYAIQVASGFETRWRGHGPAEVKTSVHPFRGVRVLEMGPGETLGSAVLLACAGARVAVADRFVAPWDPGFHLPFYRALLRSVESRGAEYTAPIRRLIADNAFTPDVVTCHTAAGEELWKLCDQFDLVLSNAVLEHVQDLESTVANLATVTRPGGYNFHQVDFRDHRDFGRPLEYLTLSSAEYDLVRQRSFCEHGCQWRVSTMTSEFRYAGFEVNASVNLTADAAYLADLRPRLHPEFQATTDEDLAAISAFLVVKRS